MGFETFELEIERLNLKEKAIEIIKEIEYVLVKDALDNDWLVEEIMKKITVEINRVTAGVINYNSEYEQYMYFVNANVYCNDVTLSNRTIQFDENGEFIE